MSKHKIKQRTRRRGLSFPTLLIAAGFLAFGLLVYDAARPRPGRAVAYLGNEHIQYPQTATYNSTPPTSGPHYESLAR